MRVPRLDVLIPLAQWSLGVWGVLALLLAGLCVWLYECGLNQKALNAVQTEVDRIHFAGEPIGVEDMAGFHRVPEGVFDATQLWIAAFESASQVDDPNEIILPIVGEGQLTKLSASVPQSLMPMGEQYLAAHAKTIEKTRQAAAAGGQCHYPIDFRIGINAKHEHAKMAYELARIMSLRLHVSVLKGDVAASIEAHELQLALAATMDHEPSMYGQMIRMACLRIAFGDVRLLVSDLPLSDSQLTELQSQITALDTQRFVRTGLIGERAMGFHTFNHPWRLAGVKTMSGEVSELQRPEECLFYLEMMHEVVETAELPANEALFVSRQLEAHLEANLTAKKTLDPLERIVTWQTVPWTAMIFRARAFTQALRDSAVCGIAFRRYQLQHGQPPGSLSALVPEFRPAVPLDPFSPANLPLILVNDGQQFTIYSIGVNGRDDQVLLRDAESNDDYGFVAKLAVPQNDESPAGGNQ